MRLIGLVVILAMLISRFDDVIQAHEAERHRQRLEQPQMRFVALPVPHFEPLTN